MEQIYYMSIYYKFNSGICTPYQDFFELRFRFFRNYRGGHTVQILVSVRMHLLTSEDFFLQVANIIALRKIICFTRQILFFNSINFRNLDPHLLLISCDIKKYVYIYIRSIYMIYCTGTNRNKFWRVVFTCPCNTILTASARALLLM